MERANFGNPRCTDVHNCDRDPKALGDFFHTFVSDGITRNIDALFWRIGDEDNEASHGAAFHAGRTVTRWSPDHAQDSNAHLKVVSLPGFQSHAVSAQALCAFRSCQDQFGAL